MSYVGQLNLTAAADRDGCPGIEVFTHGARNELAELAQPVLIPTSWATVGDPVRPCPLRRYTRTHMTEPPELTELTEP